MAHKKLTKRQQDIMKILWEAGKPLVASDFLKYDDSLNINTVQASLRALIKEDYIQIDDIVYSGTVLSRSYVPTVTADEFVKENYADILGSEISFEIVMRYIHNLTDVELLDQIAEALEARRADLS